MLSPQLPPFLGPLFQFTASFSGCLSSFHIISVTALLSQCCAYGWAHEAGSLHLCKECSRNFDAGLSAGVISNNWSATMFKVGKRNDGALHHTLKDQNNKYKLTAANIKRYGNQNGISFIPLIHLVL